MRTYKTMMQQLLGFANENDLVRAVGMEGSRVNANIPADEFQDYDITYFVTDLSAFTKDDAWLSIFGTIIMLQKPEDMELFEPEEAGYSYLMLFEDDCKLDLTLRSVNDSAAYLKEDSLRTILLDKDAIFPKSIEPNDRDYWIQKPSARSFDDCCNEFWNIAPYVTKGLCRNELLFAIDHLHLMRNELLRMLAWRIGLDNGFTFSLGKHYKFIDRYLPVETWRALLSTYREDTKSNIWKSLFKCLALFRTSSQECATAFGYKYPAYDANVTRYIERFLKKYEGSLSSANV